MIDVDDRDPSNRYAVFSGTTDTLFNNPIVSVLLIDKIESFCSSCFKPLIDKKVYCNNCKFVFYCSNECRQSDLICHQLACIFFQNLNKKFSSNFHFLAKLYIACINDNDLKEQIDEMCQQRDHFKEEHIQLFLEHAAVMINYIEIANKAMKNPIKDSKQDVIQKILQYSCVIQLNSFSIYDTLNENIIGIGLYYPSNYFNHSNNPNCIHYFYGNQLRIIIKKNKKQILKGDQLTISYCNFSDQNKQNNYLLQQYFIQPSQNEININQSNKSEVSKIIQILKKSNEKELGKVFKTYNKQLREYIYYDKIDELYQNSLKEQKFEFSYYLLKEMIKMLNIWLDSSISPIHLWKQNELSKLGHYLGKLQKSYKLIQKNQEMSKILYRKDKGQFELQVLEEMQQRKQEIENELQYQHKN